MIFLTRLRNPEPVFKGEITAFLALIFILMLSMVGALLQSASVHIEKQEMIAVTQLALESTFAEYHKEALERYDIFARFGCDEGTVQNRMQYYGASGMNHMLYRIELLTDHGGEPFFRQAVRYMKNWIGVADKEEFRYEEVEETQVKEKEKEVNQTLEEMLKEEEAELPKENNPIETTQKLKETGLLNLLVSNPEELSNRNMELSTSASHRTLKQGNYSKSQDGELTDQALFVAYITEHFTQMTKPEESRTLLYEQEYLLGGKACDRENLEAVCEKILLLRMAINYIYLQSSDIRKAEAEALAATLCSLLTVPEITGVVKQALLLAWAYGESIVDVRVLLKSEKVPVIKSDETWQLQLQNLVTLGTEEENASEKPAEKGMTYADYVKALLLLEDESTLSMRCLDLIESNLQIQADQCMTKAAVKSNGKYQFTTIFGYQ